MSGIYRINIKANSSSPLANFSNDGAKRTSIHFAARVVVGNGLFPACNKKNGFQFHAQMKKSAQQAATRTAGWENKSILRLTDCNKICIHGSNYSNNTILAYNHIIKSFKIILTTFQNFQFSFTFLHVVKLESIRILR